MVTLNDPRFVGSFHSTPKILFNALEALLPQGFRVYFRVSLSLRLVLTLVDFTLYAHVHTNWKAKLTAKTLFTFRQTWYWSVSDSLSLLLW